MNRFSPVLFLIVCFAFAQQADAQNRRSGVSFAGQRATAFQSQGMPMETMNLQMADRMQQQRFGMESWQKQFSSVGQRRSSLQGAESRLGNQRFEGDTVVMPEVAYGMARHNQRMAELRERAGIATDERAARFERSPRALVDLQNVQHFTDSVVEADLDLINRYQFRRNRGSGIPVTPAGGG